MERYLFDLSILFVATVLIAYILNYLRQPLIVSYILAGALIGPWGLGYIKEIEFISLTAHLGIIFLLFLAGLVLHPQKLVRLFKETFLATLLASFFSFLTAFFISIIIGFGIYLSSVIGISLMFSSTVLTVKLLPTTKLHHKKIGAICIGILILEDVFAVLVLAFISSYNKEVNLAFLTISILVKVMFMLGLATLAEIYLFRKIVKRIEKLHEMIFIFALAWCFGIGWIASKFGLSPEIGAFIAGVALARHPISLFISEKLKPLRDFFLLLFFFSLGAKINFFTMVNLLPGACLLVLIYIFLKPLYFRKVLEWVKEEKSLAKEAGIRLGQASEFSLLIAFALVNANLIGLTIFNFIQLVTVLTLIVSSYIVIFLYPTPIGLKDELIQQ